MNSKQLLLFTLPAVKEEISFHLGLNYYPQSASKEGNIWIFSYNMFHFAHKLVAECVLLILH